MTMLNISRTGIVTQCLAACCITGLVVVAGSTARAANDQSKTDQQKQNQQQAQSKQSDNAQPQAKSQEQDEQNSPEAQQQNADQQQAAKNESNHAENSNQRAWPAPQRYEYRHANASNQPQLGQRENEAGRQQRASLGVNIVSSENGQGVTVMRIIPNTAAQKMGLHRRDRITSLNGQPVRSVDQFISDIRDMQPGQQVALGIVRNGNKRTVRGQLEGFAESVIQTQGPNGIHEYRRFQGVIEPNQGNEYSSDESQRESENRQAGYEENEQHSPAASSDVSARISRIEQRIDQLTQQIDRLREAVGPTRLSERPGALSARDRNDENAGQSQPQFRDSQQAEPSQSSTEKNSNQ
jgi:PDZ domain